MRLTQGQIPTLRDAPGDADTPGTRLLLRAGYLRKVGSGLYAHLPLMTRLLRRLEALIREELDAIAQEVSLPMLHPEALWQASGRWDAYTRAEGGTMLTVRDRAGRAFALGPTHEEVALDVVRAQVRSYRDLPVCIYQIGRKFRDELRPRAGLLRTREFTMKDAYSFHADPDSLADTYAAMGRAYAAVLTRLGTDWRMVEADSGQIGGAHSREFMLLSAMGEDEVLLSPDGHYAANVERAVSLAHAAPPSPFTGKGVQTVQAGATADQTSAALGCDPAHLLWAQDFRASWADGEAWQVRALHRGDHVLQPVKVWNAVQARHTETLLGLDELAPAITPPARSDLILCDGAAAQARDFAVEGAPGQWHTGLNWGTDRPVPEVADLRQAQAGEACVHDPAQRLTLARGIEVGHVFQLGTRYSVAMQATFTAPDGSERPILMGCYGIGVTRLAQAVAEQCADDRGLVWPEAIAPYPVILSVVDTGDAAQMGAAETLYAALRSRGLDPLLDDRPLRAGVKFADAELLGIPWRVTLGRGVQAGEAEITRRRSGECWRVPLAEVEAWLAGNVAHRT